MGTINDFEAVVKNAQKLLAEDKLWIERYTRYAESMFANIDIIEEKRGKFNEWSPLYFYMNTSKAMDSKNKLIVDVRYMGQTVAQLTCDKNDKVTISTKDDNSSNQRDFDCSINLNNADWKKAVDFRKFYINRERIRNKTRRGNKEHNIENMLITEFSKKSGNKLLRGIQPVKLAKKIRFATPTTFSASRHNQLRVAKKGGGIDILARVGTSGRNVRLCIIEVKDENVSTEPPQMALQQAIEYTVFIRELLRSDAGLLWWKLFGFSGEIPAPGKLTLCAACAMPSRTDKPDDESFAGKHIDIDGDTIECHYIYYNLSDDGNSFKSIKTSLPQSK